MNLTDARLHELLEALADIAYSCGGARYYGGDSRADIQDMIQWAKDFEEKHVNTNWGEHPDYLDYMDAIDSYAHARMTAAQTERRLKGVETIQCTCPVRSAVCPVHGTPAA